MPMQSGRRAYGEFCPVECWRGKLAEVLTVFDGSIGGMPEPFEVTFSAVVLWAQR
jgi:hypothetical protein